ncbi:MAG: hypothetical protein ACYS32_01400 [Planctomycetota bacterium]
MRREKEREKGEGEENQYRIKNLELPFDFAQGKLISVKGKRASGFGACAGMTKRKVKSKNDWMFLLCQK